MSLLLLFLLLLGSRIPGRLVVAHSLRLAPALAVPGVVTVAGGGLDTRMTLGGEDDTAEDSDSREMRRDCSLCVNRCLSRIDVMWTLFDRCVNYF